MPHIAIWFNQIGYFCKHAANRKYAAAILNNYVNVMPIVVRVDIK